MAIGEGTGFGSLKGNVTVYLVDTAGNATEVSCTTGNIPSGEAGYAVGCKLMNTTNGTLYTNTGSITSCTFTAVNTDTAGNIALTTGSIIIGAAGVGAALDVKTSGQILVGNGTTAASVPMRGDATLNSDGSVTIANNAVTSGKIIADAVTTAKIADANVTGAKLASGKIYGVVAVPCNGTNAVNVFGTTNGFAATVTGIYLSTLGTTSATITVKGDGGATIGTITSGSSTGAMAGAQATLTNTSITSTGTCTITSSKTGDTSKVFVVFTVA